ncbi:MAG: Sua5/YciO/YrdC/YwlC family protein [Lewinellaceae bacterium]|nr:Sua5/YciO/YrdC/YwlC family protein [Lewinellaceae bacterium]
MYLLRDDIAEITQVLSDGGIICYPTDTIWGIGCDPWNQDAMARLEQIKGGPSSNGYILLVDSLEMLRQYVPKINPRLETLLSYHQRPLTLIYEKPIGIPDAIKGKNGTVAIRIASDEFCQELIGQFGKPLVSTAASRIDADFPATFGAISSEILAAVNYVVRHRRDNKEPGEPSPMARLDRHKELEFIRE